MKRAIVLLLTCALMLCAGSLFAKGKDLAIISASRFDNYVYQYKMWKSLEGFDVTIKKADSLAVRDSLHVWKWIHETWWPGNDNFVFLLGKGSEIPANLLCTSIYPEPVRSDYFDSYNYSAHDTSTLSKKKTQNLILGRLVAESGGEAVLKKLLSYEFNPHNQDPKRTLFSTAYLDLSLTGRTHAWAFAYNSWTNFDTLMFEDEPYVNWTGSAYHDSLEKRFAKYSINFVSCHGDSAGWHDFNGGHKYHYSTTDLPLASFDGHQFYIAHSCDVARFLLYRKPPTANVDYWSLLDRLVCQTNSSLEGPIGATGLATGGGGDPVDAYISGGWAYRKSDSLCTEKYNTWGAVNRSWNDVYNEYVGDPSTSVRYTDASTSEVAPSSYISVSSPSVIAYTGSDVGSIRVSAYAPNTGWFSTTTLSGNTYTTFTTTARPLFIAFTKDDASKTPTIWTTGGTLDVNTWMLGKINVNGDLTVASGKTMEVLPGTIMYFRTNYDDRSSGTSSTKAELIINGTLKADSCNFTRKEASGYWSGIKFSSTASSSSHILGCVLYYGVTGIYIDQADPTISDNVISGNDSYGIYVTGSGAWPVITNNYIGGDDYAVYIYATSSGGHYGHDSFKDATYGLFLANGSPVFEGESNGYNFWDSSITNKRVYVYNGYLELGTAEDPGNNSFTKGSDNTKDYIYNATGTTVYARSCYFYDCPTPDTDWFYGSVDRANKLGSAPDAGPDFDIPKITNTPMRQYVEIKRALANGATFSHAKALTTLVVENIDSEFAARPLDLLLGNLSKEEGQKVINNVGKYDKMHDAVRFALDQWQVRYDSQKGIPDEALLNRYQGTAFEKAMALTFAAGLASNGQKEKAIEVLTKANQDTDPLILASLIEGLDHPESLPAGKEEATPAEKQSVEVSAFPNPFNSESRIQFKLAQKGLATITVYNMLGQKVIELVNGERSAGTHIVTWSGRNQAGLQVPTGVYFCQINAGGARQTLKIFMLR
ncbi:MAG TPA: T9SS type A sorting domain-containing protein [bacterium]|nr:T9SS type A sorting domain-containing protein [bacterium]HQG45443.1 T9SS type A sorting domain-containing protein [bacterium]HQJ66496.1 T9SS type A sorting domain-containing protein [bacterium]